MMFSRTISKTSTAPNAAPAAAPRSTFTRWAAAASVVLLGAAAFMIGADARAHGNDKAAEGSSVGKLDRMSMSKHAQDGEKANGSGVRINAKTAKSIAIGKATPMTIEFSAARVDGAKATLRAPQGVTVTRKDGSAVGDIALKVGQPTKIDLLVTAANDGLQYLDVDTTQDGRGSVRSVALSVGSGKAKLKSEGRVEVTPEGRRIKVIEVQAR